MSYETIIKEGEHLKALLKLTKLTKEECESAPEDLAHLFDGYISTLYLHGHPPLRKSSNITPSLIETLSNQFSLPIATEFPQTFS